MTVDYIPAKWCPHCSAKTNKSIKGYYKSAFYPNPAYTDATMWFQSQSRDLSSNKRLKNNKRNQK